MWRAILIFVFLLSANAQPAFTIYSKTVNAEELPSDPDQALGAIFRVFLKEYATNKHLEPTAIELAAMKRRVAATTPRRQSSDRPVEDADSFESSMILMFKFHRF